MLRALLGLLLARRALRRLLSLLRLLIEFSVSSWRGFVSASASALIFSVSSPLSVSFSFAMASLTSFTFAASPLSPISFTVFSA